MTRVVCPYDPVIPDTKIPIPDGEKLKNFLHIGKWNFIFPEQGQGGSAVQDATINLGTFYTVLTRGFPLGSIPEDVRIETFAQFKAPKFRLIFAISFCIG
jgi:hypothetical protein